MKTLLLMRHGEAGPVGRAGDKNRTLTVLGKLDAALAGRNLASLTEKVELFVSSDARRARQTADIAAAAAGYTGTLVIEEGIYEANVDALLSVIHGLPQNVDCVVLVGHNPGLVDLASVLPEEGTAYIELRTAAIVHLKFSVEGWHDVRPSTAEFVGLYTPGEY